MDSLTLKHHNSFQNQNNRKVTHTFTQVVKKSFKNQ